MLQELREDEQKIKAKSGLEDFCSNLRGLLADKVYEHRFKRCEKEQIEKALQDMRGWICANRGATKNDFGAEHEELKGVMEPIMMKVTMR
eukprot:3875250-Alexandrium_andersonii.AAC.1